MKCGLLLQDKLVHKDFNIKVAGGGAQRPTLEVYNVTVMNHFVDVRLTWTSKGTTRIPRRGVYGPLISAVSIVSGKLFLYVVWENVIKSVCFANDILGVMSVF